MFVSEDNFRISTKNLYTASEIIHLVPLFDKNAQFKRFLVENAWVCEYFPNFSIKYSQKTVGKALKITSPFSKVLDFIDNAFFITQRAFMSRKITNEHVSKDRIQFHPNDLSSQVLSIWNARKTAYFVSGRSKILSNGMYSHKTDLTPGS